MTLKVLTFTRATKESINKIIRSPDLRKTIGLHDISPNLVKLAVPITLS